MTCKQIKKLACRIAVIIPVMITNAFALDDPCGGPAALLNLIDRPGNTDSACVVPYQHVELETGYQYQKLPANGDELNLPEAELRFGLPVNNELVLSLPNYIHQSSSSPSGFGATGVGIKHEIGYTEHWLGAVEGLFTLPSGSHAFGSHGLGAVFNGIVTYSLNSQISFTGMLGLSTSTASSADGGKRFSSINPDLIFTWAPKDTINLFAEIYGQSKTGSGQGRGFNCDSGIIYLLQKNIAVDAEIAQRINGSLDGFQHYLGMGLSAFF